MKKKFNVPKTFIITGIVQAAFLLFYALSLLFISYFENDFNLLISCLLMITPVMPICFSMNFIALIYACYENKQKYVAKWLYIILTALICFLRGWFTGLNGLALPAEFKEFLWS